MESTFLTLENMNIAKLRQFVKDHKLTSKGRTKFDLLGRIKEELLKKQSSSNTNPSTSSQTTVITKPQGGLPTRSDLWSGDQTARRFANTECWKRIERSCVRQAEPASSQSVGSKAKKRSASPSIINIAVIPLKQSLNDTSTTKSNNILKTPKICAIKPRFNQTSENENNENEDYTNAAPIYSILYATYICQFGTYRNQSFEYVLQTNPEYARAVCDGCSQNTKWAMVDMNNLKHFQRYAKYHLN